MLNILAFGVTCEIDDDGGFIPVIRDQLRLTQQEAEAVLEAEQSRLRAELRPDSVGYVWTVDPSRRRTRRHKSISVDFVEFAELSDGRRVTVRSDRGLNWGWNHSLGAWYGMTQASLTKEVRDYFEAEAEDCCPITPEWVVERLQRLHGVEIDPASVDAALQLPLKVEFGPRLLEQLPT